MRYYLTAIAVLLLAMCGNAGPKYPYQDASRPVKERVEDLISHMTIEEKSGNSSASWAGIPTSGMVTRLL